MLRGRRPSLQVDPGNRPFKRRGAIAVLPALFTIGNCLCGFAALHYAAVGDPQPGAGAEPRVISNFAIAGYFIFAAMFFDLFDGFLARLARATSDFGAELDSLADMVSFGVAPAFLTLELIGDLLHPEGGPALYDAIGPWANDVMGKLFWVIGATYVACTALRLARFNVLNKHDVEAHQAFRGLPSPGAAGVVASTIIFFETLHSPKHFFHFYVGPETRHVLGTIFPYVMPALLLAAALLMVSRFPYSHLMNRFIRRRRRFNYLVLLLLLGGVAFWQPQITALLVIYIYALSAPVLWLYHKAFPHPQTPVPPGSETRTVSP